MCEKPHNTVELRGIPAMFSDGEYDGLDGANPFPGWPTGLTNGFISHSSCTLHGQFDQDWRIWLYACFYVYR
jgi:hypothetical protein